jgi:hypothetical protein
MRQSSAIRTSMTTTASRYASVHGQRLLSVAHGAALDAVLSRQFVPVTNASARFIGRTGELVIIDRKLMLVNRDHIVLVALEVDRVPPSQALLGARQPAANGTRKPARRK